jgi:hypothetical protein
MTGVGKGKLEKKRWGQSGCDENTGVQQIKPTDSGYGQVGIESTPYNTLSQSNPISSKKQNI